MEPGFQPQKRGLHFPPGLPTTSPCSDHTVVPEMSLFSAGGFGGEIQRINPGLLGGEESKNIKENEKALLSGLRYEQNFQSEGIKL